MYLFLKFVTVQYTNFFKMKMNVQAISNASEADGVVPRTPAVVRDVLPDAGALPPVAEGAERVLIMAGLLATLL